MCKIFNSFLEIAKVSFKHYVKLLRNIILKWMLGESGGAVYSGAIGEDDFAETLKEQVAKCKLETSFFVQSELPTGTCAALVSGQGHRSLVANLAAANTYKASHLDARK